MNQSLSKRLQLRICIGIAVLFLLAGLVFDFAVKTTLYGEFDSQLMQACYSLGHLVETDGYAIESEMRDGEWPQFSREENPEYYELLDANSMSVERSKKLGSGSLLQTIVQPGDVFVKKAILPNGLPGRVGAISVFPEFDRQMRQPEPGESMEEGGVTLTGSPTLKDKPVTVVIARDTVSIQRLLSRLRWVIVLTTMLAILFGILLAKFSVQRGIAPLTATVDKLAIVDSDNLQSRFDMEDCPAEVAPVIDELNNMLGRLAFSFDRERQFSANIAHELRTPLAGLKNTIEIGLRRERDSLEYRMLLQKCRDICDQTESVLENMLALSRIEADRMWLHVETVDIKAVLESDVNLFRDRAESRGLTFDVKLESPTTLATDAAKLRLIFRNLLDNAVSYSVDNSAIEINSSQKDSVTRISFSNQCSDIRMKPSRWFDRFWRDDQARSETGVHCGIGLSLSQSVARLLGGDLAAAVTKTADGNEVILTLELTEIEIRSAS